MATIRLMHAKLHRVRVTDAKRDYVGSITIDQELLEKVGILPLEEVEIVNISNVGQPMLCQERQERVASVPMVGERFCASLETS
jgi:Aspartate decarboxylase